MKQVQIYRVDMGDMGNVGMMPVYSETNQLLDTFLSGELPWRNNQHNISCVLPGTYTVKWVSTPKHPSGIYMLQGVPDRSDCEMHNGNYFGDTTIGLKSDVVGCILIARQIGMIGGQLVVEQSDLGLADFNALINKEDFQLTIHAGQPSVAG